MDQTQGNDDAAAKSARSSYDLRILAALRRIIRSCDLHSQRLKQELGLTAPQLICLLTVAQGEGQSVSEVSEAVHLSPSTMVGILDRLELRGLLRRERSSIDRRRVLLAVTDAGRELLERAPSPLHNTLAAALAELPIPEQGGIAIALERVIDLMEIGHIAASPILASEPMD